MGETRSIRAGIKQLRDNYNEVANDIGNGAAKILDGARGLACDAWKNRPDWFSNSPNTPLVHGFMEGVCDDPPAPPTPPDSPEDLPFSGGQCSGNAYTIKIYYKIWMCYDPPNLYLDSNLQYNVYDPIKKITRYPPFGQRAEAAGVTVEFYNGQTTDINIYSFTGGVWTTNGQQCSSVPQNDAIVSVSNIEIINNSNPADNCGDPPPIDTEPKWDIDNPNYQPPSVNVDIDPPNFYPPDFPEINVRLQFNTDLSITGDNFTINFEGGDIVMNYDSGSPPPFVQDDDDTKFPPPGAGRKECATGDLTLPDRFDFTLPELLGDLWDKIDDYIPTPVPGISVGDLLNLLAEILDNTENGGEEIDVLKLPYYDCEGQQFAEVPVEAVRSSIENFPLDKFTEAANNAKLWCDEPTLIAGVPEWWAIRPGANRPQMVVSFRRDGERSYGILTIPHYHSVPAVGSKPLSSYRAGNIMGRERLIDNSQLIVNCETTAEAERMLNEMSGWVRSDMRTSPPNRTYQERQGNAVKVGDRAPKKVMIFPNGRDGSMQPAVQWKINPDQLM
jgi:hypothetical protein